MSGYHMALVAGVVFFVLRACLALVPGLASARPIKKWSAIGALIHDPDSKPDRPVFNRTVGLRDTFAKEVGGRPA